MFMLSINFGMRIVGRLYFSYKIDGRIDFDFEEFMDTCMAIMSFLQIILINISQYISIKARIDILETYSLLFVIIFILKAI